MRIGVLGTGLMGAPMAQRLKQAGHDVVAWNRSAEKLEPLRLLRIETVDRAAAAIAPLTLTMLTDAAALQATLFPEDIVPSDVRSQDTRPDLTGCTILQMGTIAPAESRALAQQVSAAGGEYLEAPVLGSIPQVKTGELILMVGATPAQFERWQPVLRCFSADPQLMGPVGAGAAVKLAMNQLIGTLTAAFSMSLAFVQRQGLAVEPFMEIVRQSALYAPTFDKKLARMCDRNFANPNFPTQHLLKDMRLFADAAQADGIDTQTAQAVARVAEQAMALGLAQSDYSALFAAVAGDAVSA
ncbi:MAG: NAD(P)-dependent oxidoreductase [Cyanobacteria bacterium J06632_22]